MNMTDRQPNHLESMMNLQLLFDFKVVAFNEMLNFFSLSK